MDSKAEKSMEEIDLLQDEVLHRLEDLEKRIKLILSVARQAQEAGSNQAGDSS